jgi:hypothetical protein
MSQFLLLGSQGSTWGYFAENTPFEYRQRIYELNPSAVVLLPGARWQLVTGHFDTDHPIVGEDVYLDLQGILGMDATDPIGGYPDPFDPAQGADLSSPGVVFVLGGQVNLKFQNGQRGNQVVDEFAICDFTDDAQTAIAGLSAWALTRYQDGRYYKRNDGAFLSIELEPCPGRAVQLLRANWTEVLPREGRKEIPISLIGSVPAQGSDRLLDDTLTKAALEVSLMEKDGLTGIRPLSQGGAIALKRDRFRYQVTFKPTPLWTATERLNQPVLESPWFDDITFAWQPAGGPAILLWESR